SLSSENSSDSTDIYDVYNMQYYPYEDELLLDDSQQYYYYCHYDQSQEYINPSTSASNLHQQQCSNIVPATKDERHAILPIRQPKGPEMSKNFATRIRRKAVSKLHAAAANRRRKSAADRRKSAMF
ncbi:5849_t:CDS:2, partial [Entrophospora sp. SA101]